MALRPPTLLLNDLPREIPLFTLSGVVLVPGARLPLFIFEPRYLNMLADAMAENRLIGIIQPTGNHPDPVPEDAPIYQVGGLGYLVDEMSDSDEQKSQSDGVPAHQMISLEGMVRFHVTGEIAPRNGYRRATVDYSAFADDLLPGVSAVADRPRLLAAVEGFLKRGGLGPGIPAHDIVQICQGPSDMLIAALTTVCQFHAVEKQALLECLSVTAQGTMLTELLEMAIYAHDAGGDGGTGGSNRH